MKAVSIVLVGLGYTMLVYGINHVTGGCVGFKALIWPGQDFSDPCKGGGSGSQAPTGGGSGSPVPMAPPGAGGQ